MKSVWRIRWKNADDRFWTCFVTVSDDCRIDNAPALFPDWLGENFITLTHRLYRECGPEMQCRMIAIGPEIIEDINADNGEVVLVKE